MAKVEDSQDRLLQGDSVGSSSLNNWNAEQKDKNSKSLQRSQYKYDSLSETQIWAYGVGHFVNDLSSACWFNYLLYYLSKVVNVSYGPFSILSGQIADALATPLVGYFSDKTSTKIGKRMPWYIGGYIVVLITFLPLWNGCLMCEYISDTKSVQVFYYVFFPAVFNFGWASVQISHMSLVPSLSCGRSRRDRLNSLRNTFSFIAILFIYCVANKLILFQVVDDPMLEFRYLSFIAMGAGTMATLFFVMQINEPVLTKECLQIAKQLSRTLRDRIKGQQTKKQNKIQAEGTIISNSENNVMSSGRSIDGHESDPDIENFQFTTKKETVYKVSVNKGSLADEMVKWTQWFTELQFYRYGFVYMGVRLYCNVCSTLLTFYLITVLDFQKKDSIKTPIQIALVPLSLYLMSVLTSSFLDKLYGFFGKKITLTIGVVLCAGTSVALVFMGPEQKNYMYVIAPVIGIAQAISLNTGITLISDVIGLRGSSGAFVFGIYSFLDKIACGVVLFVCTNSSSFDDPEYIRWVTVLVPSISCIFAWILVVLPVNRQKYEDDDGLVSDVDQESLMDRKKNHSLAEELAI